MENSGKEKSIANLEIYNIYVNIMLLNA